MVALTLNFMRNYIIDSRRETHNMEIQNYRIPLKYIVSRKCKMFSKLSLYNTARCQLVHVIIPVITFFFDKLHTRAKPIKNSLFDIINKTK